MKLFGRWHILSAVSVFAVYIFLRLRNLTDSCLWFDEIFSVHTAEHSFTDLFWFVAQDLIHPPLFYVLLKIWILIGGESLFWLRLFPVIFSIIAVYPFAKLYNQLTDNYYRTQFWTFLTAFIFFAVNGSLIKYAQEVRMYSLLQCISLFSLWLFVRYVHTKKGFTALLVVNILLVYTHYFGWFIIASEILAALFLARQRLKLILLMFVSVLITFAPWIYAVWQASEINANVGQNIGWMTKPNVSAIFKFAFDLFEPIYFEQSNADAPAIILITLPIIAVALIAFGFYFYNRKNENDTEKRNFSMLLIFFFTPVLLAFAASWILPYSIWGTRHLIAAFAPLMILTAIAHSKIALEPLKIIVGVLLFGLFVAAFAFQATRPKPNYIWCAWENLANDLDKTQPTKIYAFEDLVAYHFWFALRDSDNNFQIVKVNEINGLVEDKAYFLPRGFDKIQTSNDFEGDRFFIAFRDKFFNEDAPPLKDLKARGYQIGTMQTIQANGLEAFLVEMEKE